MEKTGKRRYVNLYVCVTKEMRQAIRDEAKLLDISMGALIRLAVGDYLALKEEGEMKEE